MALAAVAAVAACGSATSNREGESGEPPPPRRTDPPPAVGNVPPAQPTPAPAPVLQDSGPWTRHGIVALAFCPGDSELVAVDDDGWLTRWRVADGTRTGATALTAGDLSPLVAGASPPEHPPAEWKRDEPMERIDCRADGAALAIGTVRRDERWQTPGVGPDGAPVQMQASMSRELAIPFLVDADGTRHVLTTDRTIVDARFGTDGDPRLLDGDGAVIAWRASGATEDDYLPASSPLASRLGGGDDIVEYIFADPRSHLWLRRGERRIELVPPVDMPNAIASVGDGLVAQYEMSVFAWTLPAKGKPKKGTLLLDATGVHVKAIAAGTKWFLAVDAGSALVRMRRPGKRIDRIEHPCGAEGTDVTALALAHDESQVAVACTDGVIRLVAL